MMSLEPGFFRGSYPPLITPFRDGNVDYRKFAELAERQVQEGSHGIVVTGTTAEPSSLTADERDRLLRTAVAAVAGRISAVAATRAPNLVAALAYSARAGNPA